MKNKSAVMQMFSGNRGNGEFVECSSEHSELMGAVVNCHDKLRKELAKMPELLELLNKLCESLEAVHADEVETYYEAGFNFGLLLGVEAGKS